MRARKVYKKFLGREPEGTFTVQLPRAVRVPRNMALLGNVVEIKGLVYRGWAEREFGIVLKLAGALLLGTQRGTLYIYSKGKAITGVPEVLKIVYQARKHDGQLATYFHKFKAPYPRLVILGKSKRKLARVQGGRYKVESRGIVG